MAVRPRMNRLWRLAEHADWYRWRPRWFWRALLGWQDRKHGFYGSRDYGYTPGTPSTTIPGETEGQP